MIIAATSKDEDMYQTFNERFHSCCGFPKGDELIQPKNKQQAKELLRDLQHYIAKHPTSSQIVVLKLLVTKVEEIVTQKRKETDK